MDKFLVIYNLPRLNHELIDNLDTPIASKGIESVIKNLLTNKSPVPDSFTAPVVIPILLKIFLKIKEKGTLPNSFYEANVTPIPKPDKDTTRKENSRTIFLMNIDEKILKKKKIPANQIQEQINRIIHNDSVGFIPGMQGCFKMRKSINVIHHINRMKDKNHRVISIDADKHLAKFNILSR